MQLTLCSLNKFILENGTLKATDGSLFIVNKKYGEIIIIEDDSGCDTSINNFGNISVNNGGSIIRNSGGVSISGNTVCINGFTIIVGSNKIEVKGKSDVEIFLNGNKLIAASDTKEVTIPKQLKENEFYEYKLELLDSITIEGGGKLNIIDSSLLSNQLLTLSVKGSGHIIFDANELSVIGSLDTLVQGNGDIKLSGMEISNFSGTVQGSGDISITSTKIQRANLTVQGSGDITGKNVSVSYLKKTVQGSGDINGFN